jgi:hypothetical protein
VWCKQCGATVIKGYSKVLRRHIRVCTRCGRIDYLDIVTGRLVIWEPIRARQMAI